MKKFINYLKPTSLRSAIVSVINIVVIAFTYSIVYDIAVLRGAESPAMWGFGVQFAVMLYGMMHYFDGMYESLALRKKHDDMAWTAYLLKKDY